MKNLYLYGSNKPNISALIKVTDFYKVAIDALVGRNFKKIEFAKLSDIHFELLTKIVNLNENQCQKLLGCIDGLNNK